jgi:hypothetical protein
MAHGGNRDGAGRKKGSANLLTQELRDKINAVACIAFLHDLVYGRIDEATINERKDAAVALLKKVLPDCKHTEIEQHNEREVSFEDQRKRAEAVDAWMNRLSPAIREEVLNAADAVEDECQED